MSHDCVKRINEQLAAQCNTQLASAISFDDPSRELILVATVKKNPKVRERALTFFASHCPFCGIKLNDRPAEGERG